MLPLKRFWKPANQRSLCQQNIGNGMFYQARDFVIKDSVLIDSSSDNCEYHPPCPIYPDSQSSPSVMTSFLKETIRGAEFDSSDPNMPLRCHPGTRLKIIKRCQDFVLTCNGPKKLRWVVGAAGVGKSVIMQSVARDESRVLSNIIMGATIFFSVDGRKYGTKAIATIAYQLAVKLNPYRLFVQRELTRDPSLLRKSLSTQFNKFIVEPFVYHQLLPPSSRLLIIIDGLDECANPLTQRELLDLLSFFCITYPSSPIVWIVASRPEPHITSFFSQPKVTTTYEKEEILVDSEEAHEDVKCYLRDKLREIQMTSLVLQHLPQWPSDDNLFKIANASSGLFAYASTVVRYISDPTYGDPVGQLDDVLEFIEAGTKSNLSGQDHPMAQLDALYGHIMSKIPAEIMANTRKLLLVYAVGSDLDFEYFHFNCNMLGMTENDAYGATHHIRSIAIVPEPAEAAKKPLGFFHKSFLDYLQDFERSGFSRNILFEAEQLRDQLAHRILEQAPDGVYLDGASKWDLNLGQGILKNCSGTQDKIAVSWPAVGEDNDCEMRFDIFRMAVSLLTRGLGDNSESLRSLLCMHVLTTCFTKLREYFPLDAVRDFPFVSYTKFYNACVTEFIHKDDFRRHEFMEHGILKQVSLQTIDYDAIMISRYIRLHFKGPTDNTWNESCRVGFTVVNGQDLVIIYFPSMQRKVTAGTGQQDLNIQKHLSPSIPAVTASNDSHTISKRSPRIILSQSLTSPLDIAW
jgi:hypothetical protein